MDIQKLSDLKKQFVSRAINNELILVPLTGHIAKMNEMFTLNETAKFIWENMDRVENETALIQLLTEEFNVTEDIIKSDLAIFLDKLKTMLIN